MLTAPLPCNEAARLAYLRSRVSTETRRDISLDRIVFSVAQIFRVPIAAVTLVDDDRQWIKAQAGLKLKHMPRGASFCAHTILSDDVLVVEDALGDSRFAESALVRSHPNIRFYAGAPLIAGSGLRLGSLCVLDYMPRRADQAQLNHLRRFAQSATIHLLEQGPGRQEAGGGRRVAAGRAVAAASGH